MEQDLPQIAQVSGHMRGMLHNILTQLIQYIDQQKVANASVYDSPRYPIL